jgi:lipid-A-disaccharide synthase
MKLFISCAEPSGDIIASEVLATFQKHLPSLSINGIGGENSKRQGLTSLFPVSDLTVHGLTEVIPKALQILKRIRQTADHIIATQPDLVITIDAFDFHIRVIKRLRKKGFKGKVVHLVAPAVWAWGGGRAAKLMRYYDALYCLLPFEPAYFQKTGFKVMFVGNPVLSRFSTDNNTSSLDFCARHNIANNAFIITVLPGSRDSEVKRLSDEFLQSIALLHKQLPNVHVVIPTFPQFSAMIGEKINQYHFPITMITQDEKVDCFLNTHFAIAASGTVALELSLFDFPFIIAYKASKLTIWIARKMAKVKHICLINILMNKSIVPELIQEECTAKNIYDCSLELIKDDTKTKQFHQDKKAALALLKTPHGNMPDCFVENVIKEILPDSSK